MPVPGGFIRPFYYLKLAVIHQDCGAHLIGAHSDAGMEFANAVSRWKKPESRGPERLKSGTSIAFCRGSTCAHAFK
jgi:hypothetical protein